MSRTFKMLISNWSRTRKFNRLLHLHARSSIAFDFVTRWSRSTSNFYVLIGQNLIGEFMRKSYAASGNLLTDSWSWQCFMSSCNVLNCLFPLAVQNEIQLLSRLLCNSWFVYCAFCWQMHRLSKSLEIRFRMAWFLKMSLLTCPCLRHKRIEKSQAILEHLMTFRSSISTGKPEQLLSLMCFLGFLMCFFFGFLKSSVLFMRLKIIHEH